MPEEHTTTVISEDLRSISYGIIFFFATIMPNIYIQKKIKFKGKYKSYSGNSLSHH